MTSTVAIITAVITQDKKNVAIMRLLWYNTPSRICLIKSGRGNGPVKPRQPAGVIRLRQGANSDSEGFVLHWEIEHGNFDLCGAPSFGHHFS